MDIGRCLGTSAWRISVCCCSLLLAHGFADAQSREASASLHPLADEAIKKLRPALVRIQVVSTDYSEGREIKRQSVGSGAIITEDGFLITNHHVAGHGTRMFCTLWDREEIEAELVGTDPLADIAVLKLKPEKPRQFTAARFGDSSRLRVGDYVLAMGSPMALSQSVTLGILSNLEMIMPRFFGPLGRFKMDGEDVGSLVRWIGHDAAIYPGNSGGPLVSLEGEIIGINEISVGLGGAIPGNLARSVAEQIMAHGQVHRSWLGIDVQPLFKHAKGEHGVLIGGVVRDSPAAKAGLRSGDLLLRLGEVATDIRFDEQMPDFMRLVTGLPIGKEVNAVVRREGTEATFQVTPAERGELYPKQHELRQWGLTVRNLSFLLAREMKRDNQDGVQVTSVRPGGPAGEAEPSPDSRDVIVEVNGAPVKNVQELIDLTRKLKQGKTEQTPVVAPFEKKCAR